MELGLDWRVRIRFLGEILSTQCPACGGKTSTQAGSGTHQDEELLHHQNPLLLSTSHPQDHSLARRTDVSRLTMLGQPWLQNQTSRIKGATATTQGGAQLPAEGTIHRGGSNSLCVPLLMEHLKPGEVTFLGSHSKTGSRIHCRISTPPVLFPKGSEARVKREADVHRAERSQPAGLVPGGQAWHCQGTVAGCHWGPFSTRLQGGGR